MIRWPLLVLFALYAAYSAALAIERPETRRIVHAAMCLPAVPLWFFFTTRRKD